MYHKNKAKLIHLHRTSLLWWGVFSLIALAWGTLHMMGTLYEQEGVPHVTTQVLHSIRAEVSYMPEAFTIMVLVNVFGLCYIRHWRRLKHLKPGQ